MGFEFWGLGQAFGISLPVRGVGYLGILLMGLAAWLLTRRERGVNRNGRRIGGRPQSGPLIALLVSAPFAVGLITIQLGGPQGTTAPGIPMGPSPATISVFSGLPWMLAAGLIGGWQAAIVGFVIGLVRAGWQTHSVLTPFGMALAAAAFARLVRLDFLEWPGKLARHPLAAGIVTGVFLGGLRGLEYFSSSAGTVYDGLDYALSNLGLAVLASVVECAIAGGACEVIREVWPERWHTPTRLVVGPYNRSLAARMVSVFALLGVVAGSFLLVGDWVLARSSARELVQDQMIQTAHQTGGGLPFFIQSGRSLIRQLGLSVLDEVENETIDSGDLEAQLRLVPFFTRLIVFSPSRQVMAFTGPESTNPGGTALGLGSALSVAIGGVPQEIVAAPIPGSKGAQLVFLDPIRKDEGSPVVGVLAGWSDMGSNPMLQPVVARLSEFPNGEAYVVDDRGLVIVHADPSQLMVYQDLSTFEAGVPVTDTAPDGTRRLTYLYPAAGSPWLVIVTVPLREVDRLALPIASRLFVVLALVGLVVLVLVHASSRRLTRPLQSMARVAESIARGNLAQPVLMRGEDEIGRLSASFDRMQKSLKARLDEMALLLHVSQRMATSIELATVMPSILGGIRGLTQADSVRLVLASQDDETDEVVEAYQSGSDPGRWDALDRQILALSREKGRIALENPTRARAVLDLKGIEAPLESLMALPLTNEEEFVGTLWLGHKGPHAYSHEELNLLSIVSGQLGTSAANTRLYRLAEQERMRLSAVLEATPDAVIVTDGQGRISLANPAAEAVLRVSAARARGRLVADVLLVPELTHLLAQPAGELRTAEVKVPDGRVMFASASDVSADQNPESGKVCVLGDITHYKKLDMLKSEFVSTVSHDLRAPLTLMRGYGTMLTMMGTLNDQQKDFVRKILDSVDQMASLVDNLLDLGRIEAGLGLSLEPVQIEHVIRDVADSYRPQAVNKQITLEVESAEGMESIEADPTLLRQAIANLVDNALKYTPQKGLVRLRASQQDGVQRIVIEDNGLGIAPTDQARLFEKFYRARRPEALKEKGAGLGLAIVKSIVEQHGGRVRVESRLGMGSTFTLELPMHPAAVDLALDSESS
jgi:two-component system phosphate regulon sensor histidine kinase PhoR